ncbi:MAG: four helix bundle protein [Spirochaetia bacterium]|nr:MAG: four helix bundle protein [Spirochaetia bacterium]
MKYKKFEELPIWKLSLEITRLIYDLTSVPKFNRDFGLRDQIRRAIISVSSNIVEGFEKSNNNEFIRFLKISKGSVGEVRNQLYIAFTVGYIDKREFDKINIKLEALASQIGGLTIYLDNHRKNKSVIRNS